MAQFRPAGLSDEDSDSDDYGFFEKPARRYYQIEQPNNQKKIENNLQEAIINSNIKEIERIISCDLKDNVNVKLDSGWTPLMHACFHTQFKVVQFLLSKGADPNLHADSVTPIMAACSNNSANDETICDIIETLVDKGSILNIGDKYGQTPLMRAINSSRVCAVQKLLDFNVNIEMRDQQGWTAVFWAVHHNQVAILEKLIDRGARLTEIDRSNRTLLDIATSHDHQDIIQILNKYLHKDDNEDLDSSLHINTELKTWQDYYPGLEKGKKPNYKCEIPNLLYGMNCERLTPLIISTGMDLRAFLLMEESDMIKLGIDMPYEQRRLNHGLRNFHLRGWKVNAVSGLYARTSENYSVLECLTTLGTHLQQVYILEATLQYTLREYNRIQGEIKFEPPDSPLMTKMKTAAKNMLANINTIRKETRSMKNSLTKISRNNPPPADLIKEKSITEKVVDCVTEVVLICSLGLLVYNSRSYFLQLLKK